MTEQEWLASTNPTAMLTHLTNWPTGSSHPSNPHHPSSRKLRLFACVCCRAVWHLLTDERSRHAVEVAERFADGEATEEALESSAYSARCWLPAYSPLMLPGLMGNGGGGVGQLAADYLPLFFGRSAVYDHLSTFAALLREVAGDPFRPVALPRVLPCPCGNGWEDRRGVPRNTPCRRCGGRQELANPWLTPQVLSLAQAAYEDRRHYGTLDSLTLLAVADALEEAGCMSKELLRHLRGEEFHHWDAVGSVYNHWRSLSGPHVRGCWALDLILGKE